MKHQGNGAAPMWVTRQPSRSISLSDDIDNNASSYRRSSNGTLDGQLLFNSQDDNKYQQHGYVNRSDTSPSWSLSDATPFVPTVYSINEENHLSNQSTKITYNRSPSIAATRASQRSYSSYSSREPIRATLTAYESSVTSSTSNSMINSSYRSNSSLTSSSSNKKTWTERINQALNKFLPSSPLSKLHTGTPTNSSLSRRSNSIVTVLTNNASDPHLIRFSRGHAANLREPILTNATATTSPSRSFIMQSSKSPLRPAEQSNRLNTSSSSNDNALKLPSTLSNSKSVFIVSLICLVSGALIFPLSFIDSFPTSHQTIQLIACMFFGMGLCIFILAILFTLSAYHLTTKARYNGNNAPRLDSA